MLAEFVPLTDFDDDTSLAERFLFGQARRYALLALASPLAAVALLQIVGWGLAVSLGLDDAATDYARVDQQARNHALRFFLAFYCLAARLDFWLFCLAAAAIVVKRRWPALACLLLCRFFPALGLMGLWASWAYGLFWPSQLWTFVLFGLYAAEGWLLLQQ